MTVLTKVNYSLAYTVVYLAHCMYGTSSVVMRALRAGRRGGGLCGELGERLGRELLGVLGTHLVKIRVRIWIWVWVWDRVQATV